MVPKSHNLPRLRLSIQAAIVSICSFETYLSFLFKMHDPSRSARSILFVNYLIQAFDDKFEVARRRGPDLFAKPPGRQRSNLTDLDPGRFRQILIRERRGQRKGGSWLLACHGKSDDGSRTLIKDKLLLTTLKPDAAPACSLPRVGSSSAQKMSPLNIRAILQGLRTHRSQQTPVLRSDRAIHTLV